MQTKRQVDCNVHCFTGWLPGKKLCQVKKKEENTGAITGTHTEALNLTEKQDQLCLLLFTALSPTESTLHSERAVQLQKTNSTNMGNRLSQIILRWASPSSSFLETFPMTRKNSLPLVYRFLRPQAKQNYLFYDQAILCSQLYCRCLAMRKKHSVIYSYREEQLTKTYTTLLWRCHYIVSAAILQGQCAFNCASRAGMPSVASTAGLETCGLDHKTRALGLRTANRQLSYYTNCLTEKRGCSTGV